MSKVLMLASVIASSAIIAHAKREKVVETAAEAPVAADSLNGDERFAGVTAFEELCSFYQANAHQSHTYKKEGETTDAAILTIDCNAPDDEIISVTYSRHKKLSWSGMAHDHFGIYKSQKSLDGKYLLFKKGGGGGLVQPGCEPWMYATSAWCEGTKWSLNEDVIGYTDWDITYTWLRKEKRQLILDYDRVTGLKGADEEVEGASGIKVDGLGGDIGVMGPKVDAASDTPWYTIGVTGYTPECIANEAPKGSSLPITAQTECRMKVWKAQPTNGVIVTTEWRTTHYKTVEKKRFSL